MSLLGSCAVLKTGCIAHCCEGSIKDVLENLVPALSTVLGMYDCHMVVTTVTSSGGFTVTVHGTTAAGPVPIADNQKSWILTVTAENFSALDWAQLVNTPLVAEPDNQQVDPPRGQIFPIQRAAAATFLQLARHIRLRVDDMQGITPQLKKKLILNSLCTHWSRMIWHLTNSYRPSAQTLLQRAGQLTKEGLWMLVAAPPYAQQAAVVETKEWSADVCSLVALLHQLDLLRVGDGDRNAVLTALHSLLQLATMPSVKDLHIKTDGSEQQRQLLEQQQQQQGVVAWLQLQGIELQHVLTAAAAEDIPTTIGICCLCGEVELPEKKERLIPCRSCTHEYHISCATLGEGLNPDRQQLLPQDDGRGVCVGCQGFPMSHYWAPWHQAASSDSAAAAADHMQFPVSANVGTTHRDIKEIGHDDPGGWPGIRIHHAGQVQNAAAAAGASDGAAVGGDAGAAAPCDHNHLRKRQRGTPTRCQLAADRKLASSSQRHVCFSGNMDTSGHARQSSRIRRLGRQPSALWIASATTSSVCDTAAAALFAAFPPHPERNPRHIAAGSLGTSRRKVKSPTVTYRSRASRRETGPHRSSKASAVSRSTEASASRTVAEPSPSPAAAAPSAAASQTVAAQTAVAVSKVAAAHAATTASYAAAAPPPAAAAAVSSKVTLPQAAVPAAKVKAPPQEGTASAAAAAPLQAAASTAIATQQAAAAATESQMAVQAPAAAAAAQNAVAAPQATSPPLQAAAAAKSAVAAAPHGAAAPLKTPGASAAGFSDKASGHKTATAAAQQPAETTATSCKVLAPAQQAASAASAQGQVAATQVAATPSKKTSALRLEAAPQPPAAATDKVAATQPAATPSKKAPKSASGKVMASQPAAPPPQPPPPAAATATAGAGAVDATQRAATPSKKASKLSSGRMITSQLATTAPQPPTAAAAPGKVATQEATTSSRIDGVKKRKSLSSLSLTAAAAALKTVTAAGASHQVSGATADCLKSSIQETSQAAAALGKRSRHIVAAQHAAECDDDHQPHVKKRSKQSASKGSQQAASQQPGSSDAGDQPTQLASHLPVNGGAKDVACAMQLDTHKQLAGSAPPRGSGNDLHAVEDSLPGGAPVLAPLGEQGMLQGGVAGQAQLGMPVLGDSHQQLPRVIELVPDQHQRIQQHLQHMQQHMQQQQLFALTDQDIMLRLRRLQLILSPAAYLPLRSQVLALMSQQSLPSSKLVAATLLALFAPAAGPPADGPASAARQLAATAATVFKGAQPVTRVCLRDTSAVPGPRLSPPTTPQCGSGAPPRGASLTLQQWDWKGLGADAVESLASLLLAQLRWDITCWNKPSAISLGFDCAAACLAAFSSVYYQVAGEQEQGDGGHTSRRKYNRPGDDGCDAGARDNACNELNQQQLPRLTDRRNALSKVLACACDVLSELNNQASCLPGSTDPAATNTDASLEPGTESANSSSLARQQGADAVTSFGSLVGQLIAEAAALVSDDSADAAVLIACQEVCECLAQLCSLLSKAGPDLVLLSDWQGLEQLLMAEHGSWLSRLESLQGLQGFFHGAHLAADESVDTPLRLEGLPTGMAGQVMNVLAAAGRLKALELEGAQGTAASQERSMAMQQLLPAIYAFVRDAMQRVTALAPVGQQQPDAGSVVQYGHAALRSCSAVLNVLILPDHLLQQYMADVQDTVGDGLGVVASTLCLLRDTVPAELEAGSYQTATEALDWWAADCEHGILAAMADHIEEVAPAS